MQECTLLKCAYVFPVFDLGNLKVVAGSHVNIVDYIEAKRLGASVQRFKSVKELALYTKETGKVFPKRSAKAGGVLKYLLREISRHW